MKAIEKFALEAEAFAHWAADTSESSAPCARVALLKLLRLYLAALELPHASPDDGPALSHVGEEQWNSVFKRAAQLPLDFYGEVFNPLVIPPEPSLPGSLSDDIADIYRDVMNGLSYYRAGRRQHAAWEWTFGLESHWGKHITGAIRALHCWIAANDPSRLCSEAAK